MKPFSKLVALLISATLSYSAYANQSQEMNIAETIKDLNVQDSTIKTKPKSYVFQKAVDTPNNSADEAWEGATYIIDNKDNQDLNPIPFINYAFD